MTEMFTQNVALQEDTLQSAFVDSLEERLEKIETNWEALLETDDKRSQMSNFVGSVHYLAGAAGVYGFISMSRRAYEIIGHLRPCIEKNVAFTQQTRHAIEQLVGSLGSLKEYYDEHGYFQGDKTMERGAPGPEQEMTPHMGSNEIYILEHNPDEEHAIKVFLENAQLHVRTFKSLHKLQRAVAGTRPYAIIVDLQQTLKDATAQAFITELHKSEHSFPVMALSDAGDFDARLQAAQIGATHFFTKPVDGYRLVDTLHKASNIHMSVPSRVLIVDDDPETSSYIGAFLEHEGLTVQVLNDPTAILDGMASFHPDLILTDLYMPGCSGLELATIIRQHEVFFDIPIVFLSSEQEANLRLAALQLGGDDFFTKSIDIGVIAKAIKSRLDRMASYALVKKAMMWSPS